MTIPVFYRPEQSCDDAQSYSPSAGKPKLVVDDWLHGLDTGTEIDVRSFDPVDDFVLRLAHHPGYIAGIFGGQIINGFGNTSPAIARSLRYTVASMVAATKWVLSDEDHVGVAVSPTSGFHHAGYNFGGGFCTFNGLVVAAIAARAEGWFPKRKRILILDMDAHNGNGTDNIIRTLGLDHVDHITAGANYRTPRQALRCADLARYKSLKRYGLVIYQAGADIHINDPLGGLLSTEQMIKRDSLVFNACADAGIPLVWNLAGGYQRDAVGSISKVLELHRNTMRECISAYGE